MHASICSLWPELESWWSTFLSFEIEFAEKAQFGPSIYNWNNYYYWKLLYLIVTQHRWAALFFNCILILLQPYWVQFTGRLIAAHRLQPMRRGLFEWRSLMKSSHLSGPRLGVGAKLSDGKESSKEWPTKLKGDWCISRQIHWGNKLYSVHARAGTFGRCVLSLGCQTCGLYDYRTVRLQNWCF